LNQCQFGTLLEAKVLLEDWRTEYNYDRPHSALGMLSPLEFAEAWTTKYNQLQLTWRVDYLLGSRQYCSMDTSKATAAAVRLDKANAALSALSVAEVGGALSATLHATWTGNPSAFWQSTQR
jgi:hypothetical protein